MIKILKNKYLNYFVALFTLFFVNEIISNPNNQFVIFFKILFSNICLRILIFMAIIVIGFHNITLAMLLLINFIFLISVPQQIEEFSNNLPDLIDKNKILKYQKNFSNNDKEKLKENKKNKEKNEKENEEKKYEDLNIDDYIPKKDYSNKIKSPIKIKESEDLEKASNELKKREMEESRNKKNRKKKEFNDDNEVNDNVDNDDESISEKGIKDYDDEGKNKKEKRKEMSSNNYEDDKDDEDDIDSNKKKFKDNKYEDTDDYDDEGSSKKKNTKKAYLKKQSKKNKKRQDLLKELKELDIEEKERIENEKEIDGTIEANLKYKNYDKKLNLRMLEEDTEDESSSSSESSGSSSSSESSSESSSKEYEDVSLTEAREHVLNKLRNKIKRKYVKG